MINRRIEKGVNRGEPFEIDVDGEKVLTYKGETIGCFMCWQTGRGYGGRATGQETHQIASLMCYD